MSPADIEAGCRRNMVPSELIFVAPLFLNLLCVHSVAAFLATKKFTTCHGGTCLQLLLLSRHHL